MLGPARGRDLRNRNRIVKNYWISGAVHKWIGVCVDIPDDRQDITTRLPRMHFEIVSVSNNSKRAIGSQLKRHGSVN